MAIKEKIKQLIIKIRSKFLSNKKALIACLIVLGLIVGVLIYLGVVAIIDRVEYERGQFNGKLISENLEMDDDNPVYGVQSYDTLKIRKEYIISDGYVPNGLLIYKKGSSIQTQIVFYSLHFSKEILTIPYGIRYAVITDNNFGYFISVKYSGNQTVCLYDFYGNKIYDDFYEIENIEVKCNDEIAYVTLELENASKRFLKYWSNGTYQSIDEESVNLNELKEDGKPVFNVGDLYVDLDKAELSDIGLDGYYISSYGGYATVYNDKNEVVSTFYIPIDPHNSDLSGGMVGNLIVIQESYKLPDDAQNYTCIVNGSKGYIETYTIDILTGEKTYVELDYVIVSSSPLKNSKGKCALGFADIRRITSAKTLSTKTETVILNKKLEIIDEVNGVCDSVNDFVKIGNSYYNTRTKILYDEDLNVIAWLEAVSPILYADSEVFVVNNDSKYGVINSKGKVVISFEYDSFYISVYDNVTIGKKGDQIYLVNIAKGTSTHVVCDSLTYVTNGLYLRKNGEEVSFLDSTGTAYVSYYTSVEYANYTRNTTFGNTSYCFSIVEDVGNGYYAYFHTFVNNPYKTA